MKKIDNKYVFLILVGMIYLAIFIIDPIIFNSSLNYFLNLLIKIVPIFFLVFILMGCQKQWL